MCKLQAIDKGLLVTKFLRLFNMMTAIDIKMQTDLLTHLVPVDDFEGGELLEVGQFTFWRSSSSAQRQPYTRFFYW